MSVDTQEAEPVKLVFVSGVCVIQFIHKEVKNNERVFFPPEEIWNNILQCLSLGDSRVKQSCLDYNNHPSDNAAVHQHFTLVL